eukprot:TRINITY_DN34127_c0_g1_i1.p1 TRINITY_DN34127_c0_g1~~TRINITY_DN34127_c0_g1_i1.p1  ORF type:complete len:112 (+),score=7.78 TRINITY_DN34127_c0_g1_i1:22-357(+)
MAAESLVPLQPLSGLSSLDSFLSGQTVFTGVNVRATMPIITNCVSQHDLRNTRQQFPRGRGKRPYLGTRRDPFGVPACPHAHATITNNTISPDVSVHNQRQLLCISPRGIR